jgi:hypothetical protein
MSKDKYYINDKVVIPSGEECIIVEAISPFDAPSNRLTKTLEIDNTLYMVKLFGGAIKGPYEFHQLNQNSDEWR